MGLLRLRAVRQMLLGLIPLVVIAVALLVLLVLRLVEANAPLRAATSTAQAVVVSTGLGDDGLQIAVEYTDESGTTQTGRLTLDGARDVPLDEQIEVAYDPERPAVVYVRGDALSNTVTDLFNGILVVALILIAAVTVTVVRLIRRRRLTATAGRQVQVRRTRYRRGLTDRTWFVIDTPSGPAWVPVYWDPAVERVDAEPVTVTAHGSPETDALISFDVYGVSVWPSGRRRPAAPRGTERDLTAPKGEISMARQARADAVVVFLAPLLGILWGYIDGSGPAGFVFATVMAVGVLFWLPSMYGSDPT
ncbi:MAG: hypothetical protein H0V10_12385 [Geodermatophilaceae bacterium]|nr:hypothetical protein [Geodermatophilaceae bacterium]